MLDSISLKKTKMFLGTINVIKYCLWTLFFILQGQIIEQAIIKNIDFSHFYKSLMYFVFLKILVMLCDIIQNFVTEQNKSKEINRLWQEFFPDEIYKDNESKYYKIDAVFFDYYPRLYDLEIKSILNNSSFIIILLITIVFFSCVQFHYGAISLGLIFILNYISKNVYLNKFEVFENNKNNSKLMVTDWAKQFFLSYKEISKSWCLNTIGNWKNQIYTDYHNVVMKNNRFFLYRDFLKQLLIELPFLVNTVLVISAVYYNYLTLTQLFVWIGLSQFIINASNAFFENQLNKVKKTVLRKKISSILAEFKPINNYEACSLNRRHIDNCMITLQDGTTNIIGLQPNIYKIRGGNGAGKTTLLNIFLGYERRYLVSSNENINSVLTNINRQNIRIIDRDAVVFNCFSNFQLQVCGPNYNNVYTWLNIVQNSMKILFNKCISRKWSVIFIDLEDKFNNRQDKSLSSGEKVILSFIRFLFSWNMNVKFLVIDECLAFLDYEKRVLFIESMEMLAVYTAIYIVSHDDVKYFQPIAKREVYY